MNTSHTQQEWQNSIGHKLRKHRKALHLSLTDLSRLSGVAVPALSHIENGNRDVKLSTLVRLSDALRIDLSALFSTNIEATTPQPPTNITGGYDLGGD
jgi:transcriptional regulator with XRE-family HTH domain